MHSVEVVILEHKAKGEAWKVNLERQKISKLLMYSSNRTTVLYLYSIHLKWSSVIATKYPWPSAY